MIRPDLTPADMADDSVRDLPGLVPLEDAAKFLSLTSRTLRRMIRAGRLRVVRTSDGGSGRVLIPRAALRAFVLAQVGE